jgi:predicted nuclease of predicted toxin-antitoxin system
VRFKVDENLPSEAAALLVADGHVALTVLDQQLGGHADPDVAAVCRKEQRALVTLDLDFADIRQYPPGDYFGPVVLRPSRQDKAHVLGVITRVLPSFHT